MERKCVQLCCYSQEPVCLKTSSLTSASLPSMGGSFLSQVPPSHREGQSHILQDSNPGVWLWSVQTVPAVQELRDHEEDGSQGKRLPNLCSTSAWQAATSTSPSDGGG